LIYICHKSNVIVHKILNSPCPTIPFGRSSLCACLIASCVGVLASVSLRICRFACVAEGYLSVSLMRKAKETLLQVKQRQTRELKARTQARCAELLGISQRRSMGLHNFAICLCCTCVTVRQSLELSARPQATTHDQAAVNETYPAHTIIDDDDGYNIGEHAIVHPPLMKWTTCINVSCFLVLLFTANCLIFLYIFVHKA
jgi:hypothetical protein